LLRAFHHAHRVVKRWHAARLAGTVVVALTSRLDTTAAACS
jgi:hypothetical protein